MSDETAPVGGAEPVVVPFTAPAPADNTPTTLDEAARQLSNWRNKKDEDSPAAAAPEKAAPPEKLAETPTSDQPTADPAETTPEAEPAEPTIEPPRSWTKEAKERWQTLPRETQEYVAQREQEREREFRRSQNEAAEERKAIKAERDQVGLARQQYETALPALLQTLHEQQQGEFHDIRTMADVEKLAREDWPRYALWDAQQKKIAAVSNEVKASQERQSSEFKSKWTEYSSKEDQLLMDRAPELSDKSKAGKIADAAVTVLRDIGFKDQELAPLWNGEASVSLRDHRVQLLILDAVKYREAKAGAAKAAPKPVPPVTRPGVGKQPSSGADSDIQALEAKFHRTGSLKDAQALRVARVNART